MHGVAIVIWQNDLTMGEDKLANLAVLSVERKISKKLCLDDVVTNFSKEDHRIILS